MKLTMRTCQATRLLLELAHHVGPLPLRASALSVTIGISLKLFEKIIRPLKNAGLVKGVRGAQGGYILDRAPDEIDLADILIAMEGAVFKPRCGEADVDCLRLETCPIEDIWTALARNLEQKFRTTTLSDLMVGPRPVCPSRTCTAQGSGAQVRRDERSAPKSSSRLTRRRKPGCGLTAQRPLGRPRLV